MDSPTSAEVVEDFKDALQDLQSNSKPTIDVLTVIAKENTAHAEAISDVLVEHIKTTRPEWKLYAIYVLDSLIRHVGPPYSTYLSRNLYDTFMGAYRHVGERLRKDLELVLRTWREPPQGSRDPRPVLPLEVTSNIENDVMRFRTIATQHQQQQPRPMPGRPGIYRDSPTPTSMKMVPGMGYARTPIMNGPPNLVDVAELMASLQQRTGTPTNQMPSEYQPPPAIRSPVSIPAVPVTQPVQFPQSAPEYRLPYQSLPPTITQPELQQEVRDLLQKVTIQRMLEPNNVELQQLIPTLESLKLMLDSQQLGVVSLLQIQAEIEKISNRISSQFSQLTSILGKPSLANQQTLPFQPPVSASANSRISTPPSLHYVPPPALPQAGAPQIPPTFDIASLWSVIQPPPSNTPSSSSTSNLPTENSLLSSLRAAGLLPSTPAPELKSFLPVTVSKTSGGLDQNSITQVRRPYLIASLNQKNPDQCRQCGRRFPSTDEGKQRKRRHLDWHFSVNSRLADSTRSIIVHRSQYLNEMQWIKHREDQDAAEEAVGGISAPGDNTATESEEYWVPLPTDSAKLNEPCSICMEPFKSVWHEQTQQPVWMDTIRKGDKYYHASCYHEVKGKGSRGRNGGEAGMGTPEPVLGKRKFAVSS